MKKLTILLSASILLFSLAGAAQAVPKYYTFEGTVTGVTNPAGISGQGLSLGDSVTYQFEVDMDLVGTYTTFGGTTTDYTVYPSYFTDYIGDYTNTGGSALPEPPVGYYSAASQVAEYNYGYVHPVGHVAYLRTGSLNNLLEVTVLGYPGSPDTWDTTTTARAYNRYWFKNPDTGAATLTTLYTNDLMLTEVSDLAPGAGPAPVPEPATLALLGMGLVGMAGISRRKLKR